MQTHIRMPLLHLAAKLFARASNKNAKSPRRENVRVVMADFQVLSLFKNDLLIYWHGAQHTKPQKMQRLSNSSS